MLHIIEGIKRGTLKRWAILGLFIGFFGCAIFGKDVVIKTGFLDEESLMKIVSTTISEQAYFYYCLLKQGVVLALFAICIHKGVGGIYARAFVVMKSLEMGLCLQVCLMRYGVIGVILWILFYMPHSILYAVFYGILIYSMDQKIEKTKVVSCILIFSFLLALYLESHSNVRILQSFLDKLSF